MPRRPSRHLALGGAAVIALAGIISGCAAAGPGVATPSTGPVPSFASIAASASGSAAPSTPPPTAPPVTTPPATASPPVFFEPQEPSAATSPLARGQAIEDLSHLVAGTLYTSREFEPSVTFGVSPRVEGQDGGEGDICLPFDTSSRSIVLAHPKGCVADLRFIRPWAVDCGMAGDHPDADALAAAILAIPATTSSTDLGDLETAGAVPPGMFAERYHGRVVEMLGYGPLFAAGVDDRDHCRLLPEPGTDDPVIEIRRDMSALFVLVDVDDELVVIRAGVAGHDRASGAEAQSRGYGQGGTDELRHLLGLVNDIRFGRWGEMPASRVFGWPTTAVG